MQVSFRVLREATMHGAAEWPYLVSTGSQSTGYMAQDSRDMGTRARTAAAVV